MKSMLKLTLGALILAGLSLPATPALAQHHGGYNGSHHAPPSGHHGGSWHHGGTGHFGGWHGSYHGHDFSHFSSHEHAAWSHGHWAHDWHHGHFGWWFIVDSSWFFYPEPVYPYPGYVGWVYDEDYAAPDDNAVPGDNDEAPTGPSWYYCSDPKGYYPYVQQCNGNWRPVPVTPPPQDASDPDSDQEN